MRLRIGPRAYLTGRATLAQPSPAPSCLPVRQARWLGGGAYRSLGSSATRASPSRCAPRASIRARPTPMTRRDASLAPLLLTRPTCASRAARGRPPSTDEGAQVTEHLPRMELR